MGDNRFTIFENCTASLVYIFDKIDYKNIFLLYIYYTH